MGRLSHPSAWSSYMLGPSVAWSTILTYWLFPNKARHRFPIHELFLPEQKQVKKGAAALYRHSYLLRTLTTLHCKCTWVTLKFAYVLTVSNNTGQEAGKNEMILFFIWLLLDEAACWIIRVFSQASYFEVSSRDMITFSHNYDNESQIYLMQGQNVYMTTLV